ncbi:MAG: CDP-alcohol phosphatidyltransferase family protein [Bacteroidaceae bacterium]|nr:CDP-alcohol phosphatidyltransferase family protein [Bacteroidaceae bacterium]
MNIQDLKRRVMSTIKSSETEDWLDYRIVRPFSYLWALFFAKLDIHPNTVTILSMIIGAGSCVFFAHGSYYYEGWHGLWLNVVAILLLCMADIFDCTDGQLARLTGKKSRLGRILDGMAGFVWFIPIYIALMLRFYHHHSLEFGWLGIADTEQNVLIATAVVTALALYSGFAGMGGQQRMADYYIQIHLFMLKGEKGSELDTSEQQQKAYDETPTEGNRLWKYFLKTYIDYTRKQEKATPEFQKLMATLRQKYGTPSNMPAALREELLRESRLIMPWNAMLTFNFRSGMFFLFCLIDLPTANFLFEIICMGLLAYCINRHHEACCRRIREKIIHNS